ncbi:hypothetical protein ENSA5_19010 [Enhygromyxa salina]|uniref:Uncharacterized protein n=1 Tax=Enhygromyxa salina TaxID=215803 RepID=A0A2S9YD44_9BACT|nr:hypothetical protein [Enhygromyxa salina]PRQ02962.1 hypothetical protein ENSA5_19010 [Enhygromyxa salina]
MVEYQSAIIHEHARRLYSHATAIIVFYALLGSMLGGIASYAMFDEPGPALMGALLSCLLGAAVGRTRSFQLRLEAQLALCQMRIEQHTLHVAQAQPHSTMQPLHGAPPVR